MTKINEFNISEEELAEIEAITELASGCCDYLLDSLVNPETMEKVQVSEDDKKQILKLVIGKTMEYTEENSFPQNEEDFNKYVESIFAFMQENLG